MGKKLMVDVTGHGMTKVVMESRVQLDDLDCTMDLVEEYPDVESIWRLRECLENYTSFQPKMNNLLTASSMDMTKVSPVRRNQSAYNLKCLTAFYSYSADVFCLALNTLDRFITKVKVQPRYLSCITTTCFYHAARTINGPENALSLEKLIRVSQCDCRSGDVTRMLNIILDKLRPGPSVATVSALTLLSAIVDAFTDLSHVDLSSHISKMTSKLVMCLCHAELLDASMVATALAVFAAHLQQLGMDQAQAVAFTTILNICQVSDREFIPYQEQISQFLIDNYAAPSPLPKLQLKWTISNRTMSRLRPGYYGDTDLPVIPETPYDCSDFRSSSVESLMEMDICEDDDYFPATPNPEDFSHHFSYPNSPSEPSPLSSGLPACHLLTYADVVSGRLYHD